VYTQRTIMQVQHVSGMGFREVTTADMWNVEQVYFKYGIPVHFVSGHRQW